MCCTTLAYSREIVPQQHKMHDYKNYFFWHIELHVQNNLQLKVFNKHCQTVVQNNLACYLNTVPMGQREAASGDHMALASIDEALCQYQRTVFWRGTLLYQRVINDRFPERSIKNTVKISFQHWIELNWTLSWKYILNVFLTIFLSRSLIMNGILIYFGQWKWVQRYVQCTAGKIGYFASIRSSFGQATGSNVIRFVFWDHGLESFHQGAPFRSQNERGLKTLFFGTPSKFQNLSANALGVDQVNSWKMDRWTRIVSENYISHDPINFLTKLTSPHIYLWVLEKLGMSSVQNTYIIVGSLKFLRFASFSSDKVG